MTGCRPEKPIEVHQYEKPPQLMLVGITLRDNVMWTIKLVDDRQKVLAVREPVLEFAKSFDFESNSQPPKWTVPQDWKQLDETNQFRVATFQIPVPGDDQPVELIVSKLVLPNQNQAFGDMIVDNINRWRMEMKLDRIVNLTINRQGEIEPLSAASQVVPFMEKIDVDGQPMYIDQIEGFHEKKPPPMMSSSRLEASHGDIARVMSKSDSTQKNNDPESSPIPFKYVKPETWTPVPGNSVSPLKFKIGSGPDEAIVSVSVFPESADGVTWASTVAMWEGQLKRPKSDEKELQKMTRELSAGDLQVEWISLDGAGDQKQALLGAMFEKNGKWFVKMLGHPKTVQTEQKNFESFIRSIQFEE